MSNRETCQKLLREIKKIISEKEHLCTRPSSAISHADESGDWEDEAKLLQKAIRLLKGEIPPV